MQALTLASTENLSHEEWLNWRSKGLGGSDAPIICGLNKYKSPMELWMEKTGQLETKEAGEAAYWGNVMEPIVRAEFTKRTGLDVTPVQAILQHPEHPFMLANLDGIVDTPEHGRGLFEAKTASAFLANEWEDRVPESYMVQVQHYLEVTGLEFAYIAVLIGGNQFKWTYIPRDDKVIKVLIQLEKHFWHQVESKTSPCIDGSRASKELLNHLYSIGDKNSKIELPEDAISLFEEYDRAKAEEVEAVYNKEWAANKLKELLGEHEIGTVENRKVTWKTVNSERVNTKRLKEEKPEIYQMYLENSTYRRFSLK